MAQAALEENSPNVSTEPPSHESPSPLDASHHDEISSQPVHTVAVSSTSENSISKNRNEAVQTCVECQSSDLTDVTSATDVERHRNEEPQVSPDVPSEDDEPEVGHLLEDPDLSSSSPAAAKHGTLHQNRLYTSLVNLLGRCSDIITVLAGDTWWPEAVALGFSAACLVAIVVSLLQYDGKEIPQLASGITLNTMISILTAGSKSALIFAVTATMGQCKWTWFMTKNHETRPFRDIYTLDDATRGPSGALKTLLQSTVLSLTSIGAVIVIFGLALDPSIQQLVSYPLRPSNSSLDATTRRANAILSAPQNEDFSAGFYGIPFQRTPFCPTGNCTWEPFQSIGWCGKCEGNTAGMKTSGCDFSMRDVINNAQEVTRNCTFALPVGEPFTATFQATSSGSDPTEISSWVAHLNYTPIWSLSTVKDNASLYSYLDGSHEILGQTNPLVAIGHTNLLDLVIGESPDFHLDTSFGEMVNSFNASTCILTPCAREYHISIVNGQSTVEITKEDYGVLYAADPSQLVALGMPEDTKQKIFCWRPTSLQSEGIIYNEIGDSQQLFTNSTNATWCCAANDPFTIEHTVDQLLGFFDQSVSQVYTVHDDGHVSVTGITESSSGTVHDLYTLWAGDMSLVMDAFTNSLARSVLLTPNAQFWDGLVDFVHGTVWVQRAFVDVRWPWIALQVSLNFLAVVLLGLAMFYTRKHKLPLWKSSMAAITYHGLRDDMIDPLLLYTTVSEMDEAARRTSVWLGHGDGGRIMLRGT
ncbi:hypothetical protein H2200_003332 [Cladophialophora chaetospira]|uniref:Uncharacterized protein n=1 Tax=Cladophialophora chaetospira TaxID=386627 RepID=A0AA38XH59_9EURO|nr:hypothetical protein H2200_003332 [Cladophialophora chaetospira]